MNKNSNDDIHFKRASAFPPLRESFSDNSSSVKITASKLSSTALMDLTLEDHLVSLSDYRVEEPPAKFFVDEQMYSKIAYLLYDVSIKEYNALSC